MAFKDKQKAKTYNREYWRSHNDYKKGSRAEKFITQYPNWQIQLGSLPERQQIIIKRYYGLESEPITLQAIANQFGCTRENIRQEREKALKILDKKTSHAADEISITVSF